MRNALPPVAIIGMAGRFPGANSIEELWRNLRDGVESIATFADSELELPELERALLEDSRYVKRRAILDGVESFDAEFFGYTAREAELSDPQQRLFLQCAFEALQTAGYDPDRFEGSIGVFGGSGFSHYLFANLLSNRELLDSTGFFQTSIRNRPDHLATNVAYKLNLKGPAVTVQTACSTSLVAVHLACQSLIGFECDMALAGGVSIVLPQKAGYLYREGGILSPDGHCRAFDAAAEGTVTGNGSALVVLKRLEDALRDGDHIEAVILGSAIGNDGSIKAGYAAPSVEGQAQVIAEAQMVAGVEPETITYIEAHGTGTKMGDPIEIAALTRVFAQRTSKRGYCAIGSLKTNIGHLDAASGVAGLIKAALSLKHRMLPPSLHFERPNPEINFPESPFFVNTQLRTWNAPGPRRAGVSSFGIGGTNVHVILEEPPVTTSTEHTRPHQLLMLSAKTPSALESMTGSLASFIESHQQHVSLPDIAYTLQLGRRELNHRRVVLCHDHNDAVRALQTVDPSRNFSGIHEPKDISVFFMFPGQGAQYIDMGKGLYDNEPLFRTELERCARHVSPQLGFDLLALLYPKNSDEVAALKLMQTAAAQPAIFAIDYSLARLWLQWGIQPEAMIGHSVGEYVAACLAGVLSLEDALYLVAERGRLMQSQPAGAMLAVQQSEQELGRWLSPGLELAAVNGPDSCVATGPAEEVEELEARLASAGVACRHLNTSHAFHSAMMEPVLKAYHNRCRDVSFHVPQIPFISNLTGTWITNEQATNPDYWVRHLRETVRFGDGVGQLLQNRNSIFLEVGPARTLGSLVRRNPNRLPQQAVFGSLRHPEEPATDDAFLLTTLGRLWVAGAGVDWKGFYRNEQRKRLPLPPYPYEPQRYWIEAKKQSETLAEPLKKKNEIAAWFYVPSWKRIPLAKNDSALRDQTWLIFLDPYLSGLNFIELLQQHGAAVFTVRPGRQYVRNLQAFTIDPERGGDYELMLKDLRESGHFPNKIIHLWNLVDPAGDSSSLYSDIDLSFWSPLLLARALGTFTEFPTELILVSDHLYDVTGEKAIRPERATLLGPCRVIPQEYPHISCRHVDLDVVPGAKDDAQLWRELLSECAAEPEEKIVAYRRGYRWVETFEPLSLNCPDGLPGLRDKGAYLITGGLGGIGLALAEQLAQSLQARLILIGRSSFPARGAWKEWLETHTQHDPVSIKIRKLLSFEQVGAEVLVLAADVSNESELSAAIVTAKKHFGEIHGVLHCAGVPGGGVIQLKSKEAALAVLAPKVKGTMLLASAFEGTPLDCFVVCSSRASILGGFGQVDYCAASAFLDIFAQFCRSAGLVPITSINWDAWQNVGMLVDQAAEWNAAIRETAHPLLGRQVVESPRRVVFTSVMSARSHWILDEHRIMGEGVMPGVAYLEMARAAAETQGLDNIEITDAFFIEPLHFQGQEQREVRVILEGGPQNYAVKVASKRHGEDSGWREHAVATVAAMEPGPVPRHQPDQIAQRCNLRHLQPEDRWVDEAMGPRWHVYREVLVGNNELLAFLEMPEEFEAELQQLKLHPALLDRAAALGKLVFAHGWAYVPTTYRHLRIRGALQRKVLAYITLRPQVETGQETITFDIVLMDEHGTELVAIEELSESKVTSAVTNRLLGRSKDSFRTPENGEYFRDIVGRMYASRLEHGIKTNEGQEVFRYILSATKLPQIVVSTSDMHAAMVEARNNTALKAMVEEATEPLWSHTLHPRPALETVYTAPRTEVERQIAETWGKVLGVAHIGVHDNYFDLGGDSVQAIQITAQTRRQGFHHTPQQLFEHQTVAELARVANQADPVLQPPAEVAPGPLSSSPFPLSGLNEQELEELEKFLEETGKSQPG